MLFLFPGQTELALLTTPLNLLIQDLHAAGVTYVSEVQISLLGFDQESRFQIHNRRGEISQILYDRQRDGAGVALPNWVRRPGREIARRPDDQDINPFALLMGHDD